MVTCTRLTVQICPASLSSVNIAPEPFSKVGLEVEAREEDTCCLCGYTFQKIEELGYCPKTNTPDCPGEKDDD